MSTDTKPSAGAMRAAEQVFRSLYPSIGFNHSKVQRWAEIIDRETYELVEALEHAHTHFMQDNHPSADDVKMIIKMWLALRRFKKGL